MFASLVGALLAVLALTADHPAATQLAINGASHVRGIDPVAASLVRELVARSATGRELVAAIDRSDLVVYVRRRLFTTSALVGRIGFIKSSCSPRLVAIEIAAPRNTVEEMAALGHELQHAAEIAADPGVCGPASLSALYTRIGDPIATWTGSGEIFETHAAAEAGLRVRRELLQTTADDEN